MQSDAPLSTSYVEFKDADGWKDKTRHLDMVDPERDPVWREELRGQIALAFPIVFTFVLEYIPGLVSIALVGHIRDRDVKLCVDAVAMATMISNVTCISVCFGLASALDTLCAQAFGAKNLPAIGLHLQTASIVIGLSLVPVLLLNYEAERVLLLVGQDPNVARMAGEFSRIALAGMPFMTAYEMLRKVLQTQNIVRPMVFIAIGGNIVNAVGGYVLVYHTPLGFHGAALSRALGYAVMFFNLVAYVLHTRQYLQWWPGWRPSEAWRQAPAFLRLGLPGLLMMAMEWWAYDLMALMAGLLPNSVVALSTHTVLITLASSIYMVYVGLSVAASIRVGNALGAMQPKHARMVCRVSTELVLAIAALVATIVLLFRFQLPTLLVDDPTVIANVGQLMVVFAPFTLIDGSNCLLQGICRGMGRQRMAANTNAVGYYALGLPLSALLAFTLHWGVTGIWLGCCIVGTGTAMLVLAWYVHRHVQWRELVDEAASRSAAVAPS